MQHHQHHEGQGAGGGGRGGERPPQSQLGGFNYPQIQAPSFLSDEHQKLGDLGIAEAASPISSRPPAPADNNNLEELMAPEGSSGNRWPRQETLALLQIRSEMDAAFRDATPKAPLWEQVSRRLAELGYKRSAKKCKEKFENVHKYYKRTKEGRGSRQDGKSYKYFTQLEALDQHIATASGSAARVQQVHQYPGIPSSNPTTAPLPLPPAIPPQDVRLPLIPPPHHAAPGSASASLLFNAVGISFSSDSFSSSEGEEEEDDLEMESADVISQQHHRKRKRSHHGIGSDERMMVFFEGLIKKVMEKQEAMQQKFLEAIEKREQDRMIREEAWKRQDLARHAREHELMAQERSISAARDAAFIAFLEKITGQSIKLPTTETTTTMGSRLPSMPVAVPPPSLPQELQHRQRQPSFPQQQQSDQSQRNQHEQPVAPSHQQQSQSSEDHQLHDSPGVVTALPEQQMQMQMQEFTAAGGRLEATSRWPKPEVLALIQLRSAMESKYQEMGPKGPLWEEISAGMQKMGYNRSAKRCKEKWENINKYFKKVKESNKKRPEDSKTCPYFHELDALYRKKVIGNTSGENIGGSGSGSGGASSGILVSSLGQGRQQQQDIGMPSVQLLQGNESEVEGGRKAELQTSTTTGAYSSRIISGQGDLGNAGGPKQPEDMLEKQQKQVTGDLFDIDCFTTADCSYNGDRGQGNGEDMYEGIEENEEYSDIIHESEIKMAYNIQLQKLNVVSSTGDQAASTSFVAMVQ